MAVSNLDTPARGRVSNDLRYCEARRPKGGLRLDTAALWAKDWPKLRATQEAGLATPEHAAFVHGLGNVRK